MWARVLRAAVYVARGHLVVFDRYTYDALLPVTGSLRWLKRPYFWVLAHLAPRPDLVLVLDLPGEVAFARKVIEAIPDGRGVHMIDGKMQDDATWKQCKVMVDLAEQLAKKDSELAEAYGFEPAHSR